MNSTKKSKFVLDHQMRISLFLKMNVIGRLKMFYVGDISESYFD